MQRQRSGFSFPPSYLPARKLVHLYQEPTPDTEASMTSGISPTPYLPTLCDPLTSIQFNQSSFGLNLPLEEGPLFGKADKYPSGLNWLLLQNKGLWLNIRKILLLEFKT